MEKLDIRRISFAAALWLGLLYSLCVVGHAVLGFGAGTGMYRLLALALPGFDPDRPLSLLLGGAEMVLYGAFGGALFATVYNALPSRRTTTPALFSRNHR